MIERKLLHGGDYNPDQWLDRPDILEEDIQLMKKAKVNCLTLGVFSWAKEEPVEGQYDLDWLETIIDRLYDNGIYTILATPTAARPNWLSFRYEETNQVMEDGRRRLPGARSNFCPSSPVMRQKMQGIDQALAKRFGEKNAVIAWHISNEYAGDMTQGACYCPICQERFREYLKERYKSLEELNASWWTGFWAKHIDDWSQIYPPMDHGENRLEGLRLDWMRFVSDQLLDFCKDEIRVVRAYSDKPVTTNFMGFYKALDYFKWAKEVDFVSEDSYPFWHIQKDDYQMAYSAGAIYTLMRSLKKQPFLLMESACSSTEWMPRNPLKRPGMHMLSSLQTIAHGSNGVCYFQWRKSRGSCEKYHGSVVDHKNGENTRVFADVRILGERLEQISDYVCGSCNQSKVAIVFDWENWWAVELSVNLLNPFDYQKKWIPYYEAFWQMGIDVDLIDMEASLKGYDLVVAPINYMYRNDYEQRVREFVKAGGTYITTYYSGEVDENNLCFLEKHPLQDVLGIRTEEIDVKPPFVENDNRFLGKEYAIRDLCALIHPTTAKVLGRYTADFYKGMATVTQNDYGQGQAYFLAAECGSEFIRDLYETVLEQFAWYHPVFREYVHNVTMTARKCLNGRQICFLQNFNPAEVTVDLLDEYTEVETGVTVNGKMELQAYEIKLLLE